MDLKFKKSVLVYYVTTTDIIFKIDLRYSEVFNSSLGIFFKKVKDERTPACIEFMQLDNLNKSFCTNSLLNLNSKFEADLVRI